MGPLKRYILSVYPDKKGLYRWHFTAPNGRIIADSGEGYKTRSNALRAARRMTVIALLAKIV